MSSNVFVVGAGTIGEPLIGSLTDLANDDLGIKNVYFSKLTPRISDRPKVADMVERGAIFAPYPEFRGEFANRGMPSTLDFYSALEEADIIIDCTKKGVGEKNKQSIYSSPRYLKKKFFAQGSENDFGDLSWVYPITPRFLINNNKAKKLPQFLQVKSCNTHNLAVLIDTIAFDQGRLGPDNLIDSDFVIARRANDTSQVSGMVPSVQVGAHDDDESGAHQVADAKKVFREAGYGNIPGFCSIAKVPTQYMHAIRFELTLAEPITLLEVIARIDRNRLVAQGLNPDACRIFSHGRDHGAFGRIWNQTVVIMETLAIRSGNRVVGWCFTPQDGNSLISSVALVLFIIDPSTFWERMQFFHRRPYTFREI